MAYVYVGLRARGHENEFWASGHIRQSSLERIAALPYVVPIGPIVGDGTSAESSAHYKPCCYISLGTCPGAPAILERAQRCAMATAAEVLAESGRLGNWRRWLRNRRDDRNGQYRRAAGNRYHKPWREVVLLRVGRSNPGNGQYGRAAGRG